MPDGDNERWQQCWRDRAIGFHQAAVNPLLIRLWPTLGLAASDRIFVPLCGKSRDLLWLHQQGHEVIGVELSPIAFRAFFKESRLQPARHRQGAFTRWRSGRLAIHCGDFFDLCAADLGDVKAIYDRASLTALPEGLRAAYLAHLRAIVPADCRILLLTTEDAEEGETDEEVLAASPEIVGLYGALFEVASMSAECALEALPGPGAPTLARVAQKAYVLTPRGAAAVDARASTPGAGCR